MVERTGGTIAAPADATVYTLGPWKGFPLLIALARFTQKLFQLPTPPVKVAPLTVIADEDLAKPKKWDVKQISNFMYFFGVISSVADYATFALLLFVAHASVASASGAAGIVGST